VGYYRVQYDPALAKKLLAQFRSLPAADRVNLLSDTWALVEAGRTPASTYLDLVAAIGPDTNLAVWEEVTGSLRNLDRLLIGSPTRLAFQAFARKLLNPVLTQVGWESKPKEGATTALLRRDLITALGFYGDEAVKTEARQRFQAFLQNPQSLPGDLIGPVINTVGRYADQATYDQIHELGKKAEGTEEKDRYYRALTAAIDPQLAQQNLQLALTNELPPNRAARLVAGVAFGGEQPQLAWDFAQTHLKALLEKLPFFGRSSFVPNLLEAFPDRSRADELERFAQANLPAGDRMEVAKGAENIRFQAMFKDQALPVVQKWLQAHS
jgi:aminopeptidase N